jgi:hypothetical protein
VLKKALAIFNLIWNLFFIINFNLYFLFLFILKIKEKGNSFAVVRGYHSYGAIDTNAK